MALTPLLAMVRKDLQLFFSDRRSVVVSFVVPVAIASFFGSIFSGSGDSTARAKIDVAIVDQDGSAISHGIVSGTQTDANLNVRTPGESDARDAVRRGDITVAVRIPKGFGDAAGSAFFGNGERPPLDLIYDPSRSMELAMVRGILTQHVMEAVSRQMFGGPQGQQILERTIPDIESSSTMPHDQKQLLLTLLGSVRKLNDQQAASGGTANVPGGIAMPYTVREQAITDVSNAAYNGYAHSFAGMAIQFLLFAMANLGIDMLLERQRGLWRRLRSAPVSRLTLLSGKVVSGAIISLLILLVCFAFAVVVFHVRIQGSMAGFLLLAVCCAAMASTFGLLVAAVGNSPGTARGITTFAVLMMVMLGGAWVPTFVFPQWLQDVTRIVPVRWAVDGFDAMTWRGFGMTEALIPALVLAGFAAAFAAIAAFSFRWDEA